MGKKIYKTIDLFAGIGGIRLGFERAGFETVYANDFDKYCKVTYDANFENPKLDNRGIEEVKTDELPQFDLLLGGFPCQAFSIAGYRLGFNDGKGRGNLFLEIARILSGAKPKPIGFLLENVKNLESHDNGRTLGIILETLAGLGYHYKYKVLNTKDYGNVPQNRERIYIVGFSSGELIDNFEFPDPVSLKVKVTDVLDKQIDDKYYYNGKPLYEKLKGHVVKHVKVYQWRRRYVRENKNGVFPTLTANMGMGGHNVPIILDEHGIRKITPRECARLQGFPDSFVLPADLPDSALYKQMGNSVSVPVIEAVARQMQRVLNGEVLAKKSQMLLDLTAGLDQRV